MKKDGLNLAMIYLGIGFIAAFASCVMVSIFSEPLLVSTWSQLVLFAEHQLQPIGRAANPASEEVGLRGNVTPGEDQSLSLKFLHLNAVCIRQDMSFFDDLSNSTGALCTRLASDAALVKGVSVLMSF